LVILFYYLNFVSLFQNFHYNQKLVVIVEINIVSILGTCSCSSLGIKLMKLWSELLCILPVIVMDMYLKDYGSRKC